MGIGNREWGKMRSRGAGVQGCREEKSIYLLSFTYYYQSPISNYPFSITSLPVNWKSGWIITHTRNFNKDNS
jgi:hypothetical protein